MSFRYGDSIKYTVRYHGKSNDDRQELVFFTHIEDEVLFEYQIESLFYTSGIRSKMYVDPVLSLAIKVFRCTYHYDEDITEEQIYNRYGKQIRRNIRKLLMTSENITKKRFLNLYKRYVEKRLKKDVSTEASIYLINWVARTKYPYNSKSYDLFFKVYHRLKSVEGMKELIKNTADLSLLC